LELHTKMDKMLHGDRYWFIQALELHILVTSSIIQVLVSDNVEILPNY
jgi:hypothetical protein